MNIPDELVQHLLEEIGETGRIYAKAKSKADSMERFCGITEASLMKMFQAQGESSVAAQKREARAHPTYNSVVKEWERSIEDEINARVANENAVREYEAWRTISANERHIK